MVADLAGVEWSDLLAPGGAELLAGGGFTLLEEIGRGGMGIVFRAQQRSPEREVALKLLSPVFAISGDGAQRLMAEAAMLAELDHPGILPLYASGLQDGRPWLAMKLASGGTLAARVADWRGRWRDCATLAASLADAVQHAHERGLIHRDLKPGNILFDDAGRAYVADFGLAKWQHADSGLTHTHAVMGTPAYMAPEVARADGRAATTLSDVYGLGAVLYFLLCGRPPYPQAGTLEILRRVVDEDPVPPRTLAPEMPGDLQVICLKALAREPAARYAGPDELAADLRRWLAGDSIKARPATRREKLVRWTRRHPRSAALVAALAVTIAGSGGLLLWKNQQLSNALTEARRSRDTAYSSLSYLTRDVPAQLEASGRLGDFSDIFSTVEAKLNALSKVSGDADGADLAHRAELYAHWSQVLNWSGLPQESRQKIQEAVQLASAAAQHRVSSSRAWVVLSMAGQLLAEQLSDDGEFAAARSVLDATRTVVKQALRLFPNDLGLRIQEAEVSYGRADSLETEANYEELREAALESRKVWMALQADVRASGDHHFQRQWRLRSSSPWYFLGVAAQETKDFDEAVNNFRQLLSERKEQLAELPDSGERMQEVAVASILLARNLSKLDSSPGEVIREHLDFADTLTERLVHRDPGNLRWLAEHASAALAKRVLHFDDEGKEGETACLKKCLTRLEPAHDSTRGHIQELRCEALFALAEIYNNTETAQKHWMDCLEGAKMAASSMPPRWANFDTFMNATKKAWPSFGNDPATLESVAKSWVKDAQAAAAVPGASPWWAAVEASARRRLADLHADNNRSDKARAENRIALELRRNLFKNGPRRVRLNLLKHIASPAAALLKSPGADASDAFLVLETMTELAPLALACTADRKWREEWLGAARTGLAALAAGDQRKRARIALQDALFPPGEEQAFSQLDDANLPVAPDRRKDTEE